MKYNKLIIKVKALVTFTKSKGIKYGRVNPIKGLGVHCIRHEIKHTLSRCQLNQNPKWSASIPSYWKILILALIYCKLSSKCIVSDLQSK